ncbi:glycosyltransferase [Schlesneria paludicola]|uniref:glycosyltransferase n=1 Tax=Schlesneria paludicola TaxID=360056 RepID=UPI00029AE814|nr:glycosyltransferase [Schlesneria paludicola]
MSLAGRQKIVIPNVRSIDVDVADHDLTLVIPAYNEESRLPKTLADTKEQLDSWGINYRVLVVDDGSRDATATLADAYGRRFSTIRKVNGGKGSAVRTGMLAARGRVVAFTDADLPYDLAALKSAFAVIDAGRRDCVFGSRTVEGAESHVERRWMRTVASSVFRTLMRVLVSRKVADTQCGLKVFSLGAAQQIFSRMTIDGFAFDAEVVYLTHLLDLSFETVPVTLVNDYSTTISLSRNAIPMLLDVIGVRLRSMRGGYQIREGTVIPRDVPQSDRIAA